MNRHQYYEKYKRNLEVKAFYKSKAWENCRAIVLIRDNYLCQECLRKDKITAANIVHHIKHYEDHPELALDIDNLETICAACHNKEHPEKGKGKQDQQKRRMTVVKSKANSEET
jgi:5-methylcytosine-specific restriction endonuclease McrA